jgi:hypothetical protein
MGHPVESPGWAAVAEAIPQAKSMHWDGCHKIYLAMDDAQTAEFVMAVWTVEGNPNDGFKSLIPQFFFHEEGDDGDDG